MMNDRPMKASVDTNVISALSSNQPAAKAMSLELDRTRTAGGLAICGPVYAELSAHPGAGRNLLESFLSATKIEVDCALDAPIWREAARAYAEYADRRRKSNGGHPKRLLADFAIGAHALIKANRLFTLDRDRYTQNFPSLKLFEM
jgi:predicted nucleic acid-binding protein